MSVVHAGAGKLQPSMLGSSEQAMEAFQTEATDLPPFVLLLAFKSHALLPYLQVLERYLDHEDMWQTLRLIQSPQVGCNIVAMDLP